MGGVKSWLMDMEEDAQYLSREDWIEKHGETQLDVYNEVQQELSLMRSQDYNAE